MRLIQFLCLAMFAMVAMGSSAYALSVENIRFGHHPEKVRMVLDMDKLSDYKVFALNSPPRIVIDMPARDWNVDKVAKAQVPSIKDVRHGYPQSDVSRIVIDLKEPGGLRTAFKLPADGGKPARLVVDFSFMTDAEFAAVKTKTFGSFVPSKSPAKTAKKTEPVKKAVKKVVKAAPKKAPKVVTSAPKKAVTNTAKAPTPHKKPQDKPKAKVAAKKPLVVIDPGHGGVDPGAIGANGVFEKHIALSAAKELKRQLLATGRYRVKMTRERDVYLRLYQRVAFARKHEADLFISLHADSIRKSNIRGASVYTLSEKASDSQTAALAARENRSDLIAGVDLTHEDKDVASILVDLVMRDTMNQSIFLANTLVDTMSLGHIKVLDNPHRYAGFAVLKAPDIPSVLVEMGFMSNRKEADMLSKPAHRKKIVRSLVRGIETYFDKAIRHERI